MGKIETTMRSEIARLAKKEIRAEVRPLAKDVRELKRTVSRLSKTVESLEKTAREWTRQMREEKAELKAPKEEVKVARLSPGLIRKLRKRLGLSQKQMGAMVGVSTVTVGQWERGNTRPTGANRTALVALRKLGKREVRRILKMKGVETAARRGRPRKKSTRKKTRKSARRKKK
jgi:DNA-binding transcriptional regulator YiaG